MLEPNSHSTVSMWRKFSNLTTCKTINNKEEVKERARRAAAAARRWREYSRTGADKPPSYKLLEGISNNEN
ncbi:hypothetical protein D8674_034950 [Pyrus ussuriensis x Pyrus communis]|uniref:Uncharacterized protein n=1 Tax=Pyrus ussuriensis x Pyrus communis TaxID=2448454 RepID=A0A5N5GPG4_9ROSA|nr:hypothetical protein D8674_034950 [Pyrus ussuriensis x Pyrus communis]